VKERTGVLLNSSILLVTQILVFNLVGFGLSKSFGVISIFVWFLSGILIPLTNRFLFRLPTHFFRDLSLTIILSQVSLFFSILLFEVLFHGRTYGDPEGNQFAVAFHLGLLVVSVVSYLISFVFFGPRSKSEGRDKK